MATIIYALSGQGRGHSSRVIAISEELRQRGHEVVFCCGGTAREVMEERGEHVLPVPALRQVLEGNEIRHFDTIRCNATTVLRTPWITRRLASAFADQQADLLITDFEAFSPRAAAHIGLPVLSFNHQEVVTETMYDLPNRYWMAAQLTKAAIRAIAPRQPKHRVISSFFFPPLREAETSTLVPPIIRPEVQRREPTNGDHVLVYYNTTEGASDVLDELRALPDTHFVVYNFPAPADPSVYPNLTFKKPSFAGFLDDLASCRAVICTAGFTLISEGLYLSKPLLVVPNRGIFEQTINALFLQRDGLGEAVIERPIRAEDVRGFLSRLHLYEARMKGRQTCGNNDAVDAIEAVLAEIAPGRLGTAPQPPAPASVTANAG